MAASQSQSKSPSSVFDYRVGWICAVEVEFVVACELLDEEYPDPPQDLPISDSNAYAYGRIDGHSVVVACLPKGTYGLTSAASVALDMQRSFPLLRIRLMVGIGGGAPSKKNDIRLGDIVVSIPGRHTGGVIHYEYGKTIQNKQFERTGSLDGPPAMLLTALQNLSRKHTQKGHQINQTIDAMVTRNPRLKKKYQKPSTETDVLYHSSFVHHDEDQPCSLLCLQHQDRIHRRDPRAEDLDNPAIHYGLIASADRLMKDAIVRDQLVESENVLCFEMKAAGLMARFPCLVIRGICDYSDTHKNDMWQGYAAATAAAYAREVLYAIPSCNVDKISVPHGNLQNQDQPVASIESPAPARHLPSFLTPAQQAATFDIVRLRAPEIAEMMCNTYLKSFQHYNYQKALDAQANLCHPGTCKWIMQNKKFRYWAGSHKSCLLSITGRCGIGKSTLAAYIVKSLDVELAQDNRKAIILYTFYDARRNSSASAMLCTLMHQLLITDARYADIAFNIDSTRSTSSKQHTRPAVQLAWVMEKILQVGIVPNVCIVIDGMNFCKPECQKVLSDFVRQMPDGVRCLLTSRSSDGAYASTSLPSATALNESTLSLDEDEAIAEKIRNDVDDFTKHHVYRTRPFLDATEVKRNAIFDYLRNRADSTFLVVHFTIEKLRHTNLSDDREFERLLRLQLSNYSQLYTDFLDQLGATEGPLLRHILKYILFPPEALSVREIAHACSREMGCNSFEILKPIRNILDRSYPLIDKRNESERVDLWHPSAKAALLDYVTRIPQDNKLSLSLAESYQGMAMDCLSQLIKYSTLDFPEEHRVAVGEQLKIFLKQREGLWYALRHWYIYLQSAAQSIESPQQIKPELANLVSQLGSLWSHTDKLKFRHLLCLFGRVKHIDSRQFLTTFELICALGLTVFVRAAIDKSSTKSSTKIFDFRIELALILSLAGGHAQTAKMLLERYNITSLDGVAYSGILESAAAQGEPELLEMLLRMRKRNPKEVQKASAAAFASGNLATLNVLRREHAFQDRDEWGSTVLHSEFRFGDGSKVSNTDCAAHIARMQLLINDQKIDVHAREGMFGNSALHLACWYGYPAPVIRELMHLGANPKAVNTFKWTPLHLAARYARTPDVVDLLLTAGGTQMAGLITRGGNSALHWASESGRIFDSGYFDTQTNIVRSLLKAGADPHLKNARGEKPLQLAGLREFDHAVMQVVHTRMDTINRPDTTAHETDDDLDLDLQQFGNRALLGGYGIDSDSDAFNARRRPLSSASASGSENRPASWRPPTSSYAGRVSDARIQTERTPKNGKIAVVEPAGQEIVTVESAKPSFRQRWKGYFPFGS